MPRIRHSHTFTFPQCGDADCVGTCRCGAQIVSLPRIASRVLGPRYRLVRRGVVPVSDVRQAAVDEARAAGFDAVLLDGLPFIPVEDLPTFERKRAALLWIEQAKHVGGGEIFAEGIVLTPPTPMRDPRADTFPFNEPDVMARYGIEPL